MGDAALKIADERPSRTQALALVVQHFQAQAADACIPQQIHYPGKHQMSI